MIKKTRKLNTEDCPRCGCWMAESINCNCGAVHGDVCVNCGRYTAPTLTRDQYLEEDCIPRCEQGVVEHEHHHDYDALMEAYASRTTTSN